MIKVINLKSETRRKEYMKSQLSGTSYSFFEALSPNDIDEKLFDNRPTYLSKEAVATFESHRKVIGTCKNEPLIILEDDATSRINDFLVEINRLLGTKHEWDIMFIGHHLDYKDITQKKLCNDFIKLNRFYGMHAYIINPPSVDKILNELGEPNTHIDFRISDLIEENRLSVIFTKKIIFSQNRDDFKSQIPKTKN